MANVQLDSSIIDREIENELKFVIATTDIKREWTALDLYSTYLRQSVIERSWRACKKPTILIDAIYLKTPHRINALMWLMSITLLVYAATEYKVRQTMTEHGLTIPAHDGKSVLKKPTLDRLNQYITNAKITLLVDRRSQQISLVGITDNIIALLKAMGYTWAKYFIPRYYIAKNIEQNF